MDEARAAATDVDALFSPAQLVAHVKELTGAPIAPVGVKTIIAWIKSGQLVATKVGKNRNKVRWGNFLQCLDGPARAESEPIPDSTLDRVEADVLVGPVLHRRAETAGVVYSMAYGDQPALGCELVDWARTCGFEIVAAGKGTKYLPEYHYSTPETVFDLFGFSAEEVGELNAKMFNSFLDGTKSAIEMAAIANATGLVPQATGLHFPPVGVDRLAEVLKPESAGGILSHSGTVEVVSCQNRDGSPVPRDLRWGVYITFKASTEYLQRCFQQYGLLSSGPYAALYRPSHLVGLELGVSVASVALRREPTGTARKWVGDVAACAKRDLAVGETLDGEGGYAVYGRLMPAPESLSRRMLPIGLAAETKLTRPVAKDQLLSYDDVELPQDSTVVKLRRELEEDVSGQ